MLGRLMAAAPEAVPAALARGAGWLVCHLPGRRRALFANLHHAFPERSRAWHRRIALQSCQRMVEMGLFALASPYFSEARIRRMFKAGEGLLDGPARLDEPGVPAVILVPHFSLMEALTLARVFLPGLRQDLEVGVFYRPFGSAAVERRVRESRERFGFRLLSRKAGFSEATEILRGNGRVAVLFDQHAGKPGTLALFLDRVASTSELPGLLAEKHRANAIGCYVERTGFWRGTLRSEMISTTPVAEVVTIVANLWLERKLRTDDNLCADWLWLHKRWKVNNGPRERFSPLRARRDILPETLSALELTACPRRERFWIRMPNWLGDVVMAVPLIRALREARPDAEVSLIVQGAFAPLLLRLGIAEKIITLPRRGADYWRFFWRLRQEFPDTHILFTNSFRGDLEAWLAGAPQRFGIRRGGKPRPLLTHGWRVPRSVDESRLHQTRLWERWWQEHGLETPLELAPFRLNVPAPEVPVIGLICGSENSPEKRWPVEHWRTLILRLLAEFPGKIRLLGTARDRAITEAIARDMPAGVVEDWAGKTDLTQFAGALAECRCLVCNDTGGMHLANLLGVPVVGIFGPTNPVRTGPVFAAPVIVLQPEDCPATGGASIAAVPPERVFLACQTFVQNA